MVTPTKYITAPDARPVGFLQLVTWVVPSSVPTISFFTTSHIPIHLTYAHRRVPTKAPKSQVANGELEDGRTDYQERENPDEPAADHGGLMGGLELIIEYFYLHPGCVRCSQKGGVSAADESQTGHQSYGCLRLQIVAQISSCHNEILAIVKMSA